MHQVHSPSKVLALLKVQGAWPNTFSMSNQLFSAHLTLCTGTTSFPLLVHSFLWQTHAHFLRPWSGMRDPPLSTQLSRGFPGPSLPTNSPRAQVPAAAGCSSELLGQRDSPLINFSSVCITLMDVWLRAPSSCHFFLLPLTLDIQLYGHFTGVLQYGRSRSLQIRAPTSPAIKPLLPHL